MLSGSRGSSLGLRHPRHSCFFGASWCVIAQFPGAVQLTSRCYLAHFSEQRLISSVHPDFWYTLARILHPVHISVSCVHILVTSCTFPQAYRVHQSSLEEGDFCLLLCTSFLLWKISVPFLFAFRGARSSQHRGAFLFL